MIGHIQVGRKSPRAAPIFPRILQFLRNFAQEIRGPHEEQQVEFFLIEGRQELCKQSRRVPISLSQIPFVDCSYQNEKWE
jgi:hypothetical protein